MRVMESVVLPPVVWSKESQRVTPHTQECISVIAAVDIDEGNAVIYGRSCNDHRSNTAPYCELMQRLQVVDAGSLVSE
jgi:hypothetical protein